MAHGDCIEIPSIPLRASLHIIIYGYLKCEKWLSVNKNSFDQRQMDESLRSLHLFSDVFRSHFICIQYTYFFFFSFVFPTVDHLLARHNSVHFSFRKEKKQYLEKGRLKYAYLCCSTDFFFSYCPRKNKNVGLWPSQATTDGWRRFITKYQKHIQWHICLCLFKHASTECRIIFSPMTV